MTSTSPTPLAHLELHTHDRAGASSFYRELLGWLPEHVEAAGREYLALDLEPREGPAGWRSVAASPDGGEIAFWQSKRWAPGR
jgi:hypothetical protein